MKRNNRKGFTTVELVIVIAVIAILATALIPTFGGLINSANKTADEQAVRNLYRDYIADAPEANAADTYYIHVGDSYYHVNGGVLSFETNCVLTKTAFEALNVDAEDIICGNDNCADGHTKWAPAA